MLYVDNDPIVLAHARALMAGTAEGRVAFIQADLRQPEAILADPAVAETLDLARPVGLVLVGVMHHLRDDDDPRRIVATLVDALAPGSYLVLSQSTPDFDPEAMAALAAASEQGGIANVPRSLADTEPFFAGLELVEPGLVPMASWRPDPGAEQDPHSVYAYGGVARKPWAGGSVEWRDATSAAVATCGDRAHRGAAVGVDARVAPVGGGAGAGRGAGRAAGAGAAGRGLRARWSGARRRRRRWPTPRG